MGDRLKGEVAIVTGGGAGIGQATAILFAEEGAKVVVADIDEAAGAATAATIRDQGGQAIAWLTDVSLESHAQAVCETAVKAFGRLDILVNNAAAFVLKGLEATVADWEKALGVNVIGTALMSRFAAEAMKQAGGGAIVNLGSISSFVAQPSFITYSATKGALVQMTRNMAMDLAAFGIRVNCVCPGTILTQASRNHMERAGQTLEEFTALEGSKNLLGRVGEPREVASAILFLASSEASFITGAHLLVDGGYTTQ
ncbi:MAG TPA: SDR family oxidoreductase [Blastocatellia bacterium]|jgi:NAD(P)-dependent dehydrogenase (short-subunit alcohol dehydrogenase family)|nr:SDR family oxidoreductase [Blastocatellia bacterium]